MAPAPIVGLAPDEAGGTLLFDGTGESWRWTRATGLQPSGRPSLAGRPLWSGVVDGRRLFVVTISKGVDIVHSDGHRVPMWLTPGVITTSGRG